MSKMRIFTGVVAAGLTLLYLPDAYSYGGVGGDRNNFDFHPWQILVTLLSVALLWIAVTVSNHRRLTVLALELSIFITMNLIYIFRDGLIVRVSLGSHSYYLPAVLVVLGLGARMTTLLVLFGFHRNPQNKRR